MKKANLKKLITDNPDVDKKLIQQAIKQLDQLEFSLGTQTNKSIGKTTPTQDCIDDLDSERNQGYTLSYQR